VTLHVQLAEQIYEKIFNLVDADLHALDAGDTCIRADARIFVADNMKYYGLARHPDDCNSGPALSGVVAGSFLFRPQSAAE
jgi:hypothetical protein